MIRLSVFIICGTLAACGSSNKPLDADTRQAIDSIAGARMVLAQVEMDSLCKTAHNTRLPVMIDSIKKHREAEIEAKLRGVSK